MGLVHNLLTVHICTLSILHLLNVQNVIVVILKSICAHIK